MTAETIVGTAGRDAEFRTCQYTGLKVDVAAQTLIKANAVAAVVFLAVVGARRIASWPRVGRYRRRQRS